MIYYVRHGQTPCNIQNLFHKEEEEIGLTEKGLRQAEEAAEKIKDIDFSICYCSPRKRTVQTMQILLKYHPNLKVVFDERITECVWGEASGLHVSTCEPDRWHMDRKFPYDGVESVEQVFARAKSFYDEIYKPKENILVISHSGFGRVSYCYFHGFPSSRDLEQISIKNSEIITFEK